MKYLQKLIPEFILLFYILLFLGFKNPSQPWDRIINSDGKGYYAYLPAIFIYHDLQFRFIEDYESRYYPSNKSMFKDFRNPSGRGVVDKYFPGLAVVWLPFFLFGHISAWLLGFPQDGYSMPYQLSICFAAFLFLWLGARLLQKLLIRLGASDAVSSFITVAIALGTNLIFFTIVEGSMSHIYSFALITAFMLVTVNLFQNFKLKWLTGFLLLFVMIVLIRPTNFLVILLVPFLAGSYENFTGGLKTIFALKKNVIRAVIPSVILFSIPFILWKLQTGHWIVYSYGSEKLIFTEPKILKILFSFNRGWFIFTPIAFLSLFGFAGLYKASRFRFFWLLLFLALYIYLTSCWWLWYYASKCGQRAFADIYPVVAVLLFYLYYSFKNKTVTRIISLILMLFTALNIFQFYQHVKWIYPPSTITAGIFGDSFFSLHQKSRVYIPEKGIVAKKVWGDDMEKNSLRKDVALLTDSFAHGGKWSLKISSGFPYGAGIDALTDTLFVSKNCLIEVDAWILTPNQKTDSRLILDFQSEGKSISYNAFYLDKFAVPDDWTYFEAAFYVPENLAPGTICKIYFFDPSNHLPLFIDNLKIQFISLKDHPDYKGIEGVIMPD